jgi:hypothetical protein
VDEAVGLSLSWNVNDAFSSNAQAAELDAMRVKLEHATGRDVPGSG